MATNQKSSGNSKQSGGVQGGTPEQHAEAGRQSHKNDGNSASKQSASSGAGSKQSASKGSDTSGSKQSASHASDSAGNKQSGSKGSGSASGGGTQGGTPEQHAAAGRQSHKNDDKK